MRCPQTSHARESSTSGGKDSNKYTLEIKHSYLGHLAEVGPATRSCLAQNLLQVNSKIAP